MTNLLHSSHYRRIEQVMVSATLVGGIACVRAVAQLLSGFDNFFVRYAVTLIVVQGAVQLVLVAGLTLSKGVRSRRYSARVERIRNLEYLLAQPDSGREARKTALRWPAEFLAVVENALQSLAGSTRRRVADLLESSGPYRRLLRNCANPDPSRVIRSLSLLGKLENPESRRGRPCGARFRVLGRGRLAPPPGGRCGEQRHGPPDCRRSHGEAQDGPGVAPVNPEYRHWVSGVLTAYEYGSIIYLFVLSTIYFALMLVGFLEMMRHRFTRRDEEENSVLTASALVAPVSVLAPAFNEAATICQSVRALLMLSYPEFEVIVINDGSTDATLKLLIQEFHLYRSARFFESILPGKPVRAVYESMDPVPLVVIDKENGGKADSLNVGINVARYPLVCSVDADSLLESDALLRVARPFIEDPKRVLAVGGIVRVANGCTAAAGRVLTVDLPKSLIARFQVVEYLRSFLGGRVAFSAFNCLLVISGAFGLFSKAALLAVGGYRTSTVGEDMELIVRLHHWARQKMMDYRIVFQPDPVCWTEVPESLRILRRQRNRWQRGGLETVWLHRSMIGRPRYGLLGLAAFPYFVLFEVLGPVIEFTGYILTLIGLCLGLFDWQIALLFFLVVITYGMILSVDSVVLEELSTSRYPHVRNMLVLVVAGILENFGYRQLLTLWRVEAFWDMLRGKKAWGVMERQGFGRPTVDAIGPAAAHAEAPGA